MDCGYGPQECDRKERKEFFREYLNLEAQKAACDGSELIIQMAENLWAGKGIIKSEPRKQNQKGKYFENLLLKNPHISIVNALELFKGTLTRIRHTKERIEESIIDFLVVCDLILPVVSKMIIDSK